MLFISENSLADLVFELGWHSSNAVHREILYAGGVNVWRDHLPDNLLVQLMGKGPGEKVSLSLRPGTELPKDDPRQHLEIGRRQFGAHLASGDQMPPRQGRFYPKGLLTGIAGVFRQNLEPFRVTGIRNDHVTVNLNHPLAGRHLDLAVTVESVKEKKTERGGGSRAWVEEILQGPGMQSRWDDQPTDFFTEDLFQRQDPRTDAVFYHQPRWVQHLDDTALSVVRQVYERLLQEGSSVLDLMSSWQSHLPPSLSFRRLSGLGMNAAELSRNASLTDHVVHDLNANPSLPYDTGTYDAVICTSSVEYLVHPVGVFKEVARVLRPGGVFVLTFSNRWFPPKVIHGWTALHEFERMGVVLEYFHLSGAFKDLQTQSVRGLPRPLDDKYFPQQLYADPVYAVWGVAA